MAENITKATEKVTTPAVINDINEKVTKPRRGRPPKKKEVITEAPKKTPRQKSRKVEELIVAATKGMTDKEKEILIKHLKDTVNLNEAKLGAMKTNCEQAYSQARELEKQYEAMEQHYRQKLQYIDEQTRAFAKAVQLSTRGGLN